MIEPEQLEKAIAHLETQRALLGDAAVDAAVAVLRRQIATSTPSSHPEAHRRQVTILFANVSGFTAMSEAMDAEDVTASARGLIRRDRPTRWRSQTPATSPHALTCTPVVS